MKPNNLFLEKLVQHGQSRFQSYFTLITTVVFIGLGIRSISGNDQLVGIFELALGGVLAINLLLLNRGVSSSITSSVIMAVMTVTVVYLVLSGGADGTGMQWTYSFMCLAVFLRGKKGALLWLALLVIPIMLGNGLAIAGFFKSYYPKEVLWQTLFAFIIPFTILFLFQSEKDTGQRLYKAIQKQSELALENSTRQANVSQEARKQLATTLKEIEGKNEKMQETQKAVLNILDDLETERQKVTLEKDKVNTILQSIGDGVFVVDRSLKIITFNQVSADISGYSIEEALGKKYDDILKFQTEDTGKKNEKFILDTLSTGKVQSMSNHTVLIKKDGSKIPVADSAAPIFDKDKQVIGCVVVFRDVTLEYEIDKAKTEFVSLASHQLRTPLSAINWYIEMLLGGDAGSLTDEQKDFLKEVQQGNQRMVDLVNSLLNVSRIDLGTFAIEPEMLDVNEICRSVIKELKPTSDKKKQEVTEKYKPAKIEMNVDPKLMRIVFQNLLSNAVKYTPEEGKISATVTKDDKELKIVVSDNGMGIPEAQQAKIFQKLFRADNVREKVTDGTGLGLYIVKSIIEQSGGNISFTSEEDKGTTFTVSLPASGMIAKSGNKELS